MPPPPPVGVAQPTAQMPARPPAGGYAPPGAQYPAEPPAPYAMRRRVPPVPPPTREAAAGRRRGAPIAGVLAVLAGAVVVGSTFLAWLPGASGIFRGTGWNIMKVYQGAGNLFYQTTQGAIFFSGFWSLALGGLLIIAGVVMMFRRRIGGLAAILFGLAGAGIAAVDIYTIYAKLGVNGVQAFSVTPSAGLWIFAGASLVGMVLGIVGLVI